MQHIVNKGPLTHFKGPLTWTCGSLSLGRQERHSSLSYSELLDVVVTRAVDKLGLDWEADAAQAQSQSKLDDRFLTSRAPAQPCKLLPFFPDLHQPFSARITNAAAVDFATISDMTDRGYATMEETLAEHLTPCSDAAWKSHPLLPSKPCRAEHVSGAERGASAERSVRNIVGARSGFLSKGRSDRSVSLLFRSDSAHTTSLGHAQIHPEFTFAFNN